MIQAEGRCGARRCRRIREGSNPISDVKIFIINRVSTMAEKTEVV